MSTDTIDEFAAPTPTPEEAAAPEPTPEEKKEAALDVLYPKPSETALVEVAEPSPPASSDEPAHETVSVGLVAGLSRVRDHLKKWAEELNVANTKDGSQAGIANHGTRLMSAWRSFDAEVESFQNFITKEGHE